MTAGAIITMVVTMSTVTAFTVYYFWKVLRTSPSKTDDAETKK